MQAHIEPDSPEPSTSTGGTTPAATTPTNSSATKRKFEYCAPFELDVEDDRTDSCPSIKTCITRCDMMSALVKGLACLECMSPSLKIRATSHRLGVVSAYETWCTECGAVINSTLSSDRIDGSTAKNAPFVVVRQAVAATMDMGVGHAGLTKLCRFLDMVPMSQSTYMKHMLAVKDANTLVVNRVFDDAATTIRRVYREIDPTLAEDAVMDLVVSFDGSWMTRGHKSAYGIGCVIDTVTGLCMDMVVLSLYCQRCSYAQRRFGGRATDGFREWFETHREECNRNYDGSSGGMEAAAAEVLWARSVERHRFRYTTMLSDGDAKTFKHLCDLHVYGDVELKKEECINHVAKRLGTALRKLASSGKKNGIVMGGRGYGKLTQAAIIKNTAYYGKAVRAHPNDLDAMRDAVWATYYHAISTDETPQHDRCPVGDDSWCFYKKALATGQEPGPHRTNVGTPLSVDVAVPVKAVYERLSHDDLLTRCLRGQTQNANESLHSKVWAKCPKIGFACVHRVRSATCAAVAEFNVGVAATMRHLCDVMGIAPGEELLASAKRRDARRLQQAERQMEASTKEARRARRVARAAEAQSTADYAAGAF